MGIAHTPSRYALGAAHDTHGLAFRRAIRQHQHQQQPTPGGATSSHRAGASASHRSQAWEVVLDGARIGPSKVPGQSPRGPRPQRRGPRAPPRDPRLRLHARTPSSPARRRRDGEHGAPVVADCRSRLPCRRAQAPPFRRRARPRARHVSERGRRVCPRPDRVVARRRHARARSHPGHAPKRRDQSNSAHTNAEYQPSETLDCLSVTGRRWPDHDPQRAGHGRWHVGFVVLRSRRCVTFSMRRLLRGRSTTRRFESSRRRGCSTTWQCGRWRCTGSRAGRGPVGRPSVGPTQ